MRKVDQNPFVIDAHNLLMRCCMASALDDLKAGGQFTGGLYGALGMLQSLLKHPELPGGPLIACFDVGVPPRRRELLPGYKAGREARREKLPEEALDGVYEQVSQFYALLPSFGVLPLAYRDREADDVVSAVAQVLLAHGMSPVVVSSDADLLQTVNYGARVWHLSWRELVHGGNFVEKCGVEPDLYVLYRTLVGDTSDSIKGARGCGAVRAQALLEEFQNDLRIGLALDRVTLSPVAHVRMLCQLLQERGNLAAWEQRVLDDHDRLEREACGIDLLRSFGPDERLRVKLLTPRSVDVLAIRKAFVQWRFQSYLLNLQGFLQPFEMAAAVPIALS